jgi:uncharacterized protein
LIPKTVLLTGASGLIGSALTDLLLDRGYRVKHLGRTKKTGQAESFVWDVPRGLLEEGALEAAETIIHLAGESLADKPWTAKRKKEILESRTHSTALLFNKLSSEKHLVKTFISASAIGYYGFGMGDEVFTEESEPGQDFLAQVVKQWEDEVDRFSQLNIRTVKIRTGIVLSDKGGALAELVRPVRWGVGAALGSGRQQMSWIHLHDLCRLFLFALENEQLQGAYNGVGPGWATNRDVTKAIARALKKPLWLPPIPAVVLKMVLGEMADLVLQGSKVSSQKIQHAGFTFEFSQLDAALNDLLRKDH